MSLPSELKRILVVVSPDLVQPSSPRQSPLISRAIELAKATGGTIELFHVCHEPTLEQGLFAADPDVVAEKQRVTDRESTLLAEMAVRLKSEGVDVHHEVRWDQPRTDAILRKIADANPDVVMKESRDHSYFIGMTSNTDWELIRKSTVNVWFVSSEPSPISTIVTAIGMATDDGDPFSSADYNVFRIAGALSREFNADHHPVHAYQVPFGVAPYAAYSPGMGAVVGESAQETERHEQAREDIAETHGNSIRKFAEQFDMPLEDIHIEEGNPNTVLPTVARELSADLVILGARNLSRWQRAVRSVTAEPVLAETPCDVLFVKAAEEQSVPLAAIPPLRGRTTIDLERAITDPEDVFGSPNALVESDQISVALRQRILQIWEQDIRACMREEGEGGPVGTPKSDVLVDINRAKTRLAANAPGEKVARQSLAASQ